MVLVLPYRPKNTNISQAQPTNVVGGVGISSVTPVDGSVATSSSDRQIVLDSHFGGGDSGIEARFNWDFFNSSGETGTVNAVDAGTMNGFGATTVTWDAGSSPNVRWGGNFRIPLLPAFPDGYPEGWLTVDMKFSSSFSSPKGMKLPGLYPINNEPPNQDPFGCDEGFSIRQMLSGTAEGSDALESHMYTYVSQDARQRNDWSGGAEVIEKDTVARVETYFKLNSAFNATDGVLEHRYDVGTSTTSTDPVTIRFRKDNQYMYCGSEANRTNALVRKVTMNMFFGGADISWAPLVDSAVTFGRILFEVPA